MVAVMVFIVVVAFIPALKPTITTARNAANLDCDNSSITTGNKLTCIVVDLWLPYFVGVGIAGGLAFITGRNITKKLS